MVLVVVGGGGGDAQQFSMLLASPMGFDPYVGNQKITTLLSGDTTANSSFSVRRSYTSHICVDNDILTLMELTQMRKVASKLLEF